MLSSLKPLSLGLWWDVTSMDFDVVFVVVWAASFLIGGIWLLFHPHVFLSACNQLLSSKRPLFRLLRAVGMLGASYAAIRGALELAQLP